MGLNDLDLLLDVRRGPGVGRSLRDALRGAVRDGRLAPGTLLPGTRSLAVELGVSRGTVVEAFEQLIAEGWLVGHPGSGTRVAQAPATTAPAGGTGSEPSMIDLRPGRPDLGSFPRTVWAAAVRRVLAAIQATALDVPDPAGLAEIRRTLAGYLARTRGVRAGAGSIMITAGFTHGLAILARAFRRLGIEEIATESPCLARHRRLLAAGGLRLAALTVDDDGADPDDLAAGTRAALLTPAHQHPYGVALAADRRAAFLDWARSARAYLIEDDYDGEFRYDRTPVAALQAAAPERVIYAGTASKALAPALRIGWLVLPPALIEAARETADELGATVPAIDQLALADLIERGDYDRQVRRARRSYQRRRGELAAALDTPPLGLDAGLHALVPLPDPASEHTLVDRAASAGLQVYGLNAPVHWHAPGSTAAGVLIGYATPPDHAWRRALERLGPLLRTP
ncbi:MocR-like pyridoxine biosynthesis transcription factor PdxR [Microlunatus parietis]|uniref:GntR family transcriptional regulator/MocR family aminotransferase n=1 Tax=Microlunatus parietis TaxID=682979 RepID=A0A7Y9L8Q0_9ACTN|nr:PLP-dependent aminotransferase family protein [Microlunatus parietis]NYE70994.1 GntR family transcriptional regulator/MocR family aminotransferase [Microlunatus parietis]